MEKFWQGKKVLVTGGTGFIGSYVCEFLLKLGANVRATSKSGNLENIKKIKKEIEVVLSDLTDFQQALKACRKEEIVLNLASRVAGIQFNITHPAEMFRANVQIAQNVIEAALINNVERFLMVSSACVYPREAGIPNREEEGFLNDPEPSNLGYGWSKRVNELLGRFYSQEYGMKVAIVRPFNAYGPRDNFDPQYSHVIPSLIKRIYEAENPLVVWGSGKQTRSFLFAEDFARGLLMATEKYAVTDVINLGSEEEISIESLAKLIVRLSGKKTEIKFDKSKPDGQPRRSCNTEKARKKIGFTAKIKLEEGLRRTLEWYEQR